MRWRHPKNKMAFGDSPIHRRDAEDAEESQRGRTRRRQGDQGTVGIDLCLPSSLSPLLPFSSSYFFSAFSLRSLRLCGEARFRKRPIDFITAACLIAISSIALWAYWPSLRAKAQSGALIPVSVKNEPDSSILSLQVMKVDVVIDNQHAGVKVLQIFDSQTGQVLEGKYLFALPPQSSIADFAVWDGDLRLLGVILEKRRANRIYSEIKSQMADPGLLQHDDDRGGTSAFSAKVFPSQLMARSAWSWSTPRCCRLKT
jgi:hypothetical protein